MQAQSARRAGDADKARRIRATLRHMVRGSRHLVEEDVARDVRSLQEAARLLALVVAISAVIGVADWAFLTAVLYVTGVREAHRALFALLPIAALGTVWLYRNVGLDSARGNNLVIESSLTGKIIHFRMAVLTFVCALGTHLTGGSEGREGTPIQIGGTVASNVSRIFHLNQRDHHDLMLSGVSAAFAGTFGTPLAGAFFGMEICYVGKFDYSCLLYCLVASFVGNGVACLCGADIPMPIIHAVPPMNAESIAITVVASIAFGLTARLFSLGVRGVKHLLKHRFKNYLVAAGAASLVLLAVYALFDAWRFAGLSDWMVAAAFEGRTTFFDATAKLMLTVLTLGIGFQGGECTPLFDIGAALGGWIGTFVGHDTSLMAALGLLGVCGGALNVPLTTIMLGIDMFGGQAVAYYVIVSFISYLVAGPAAIYPAQRIITPKLRSNAQDESHSVADAIKRRDEKLADELGLDDGAERPEPAAPSAPTSAGAPSSGKDPGAEAASSSGAPKTEDARPKATP